jgi:hypothetical protein
MGNFDDDTFFDSELSELTSEDEDEETPNVSASTKKPVANQTKRKSASVDDSYTLQDVMRPPRAVQYTVKSLYGASPHIIVHNLQY